MKLKKCSKIIILMSIIGTAGVLIGMLFGRYAGLLVLPVIMSIGIQELANYLLN